MYLRLFCSTFSWSVVLQMFLLHSMSLLLYPMMISCTPEDLVLPQATLVYLRLFCCTPDLFCCTPVLFWCIHILFCWILWMHFICQNTFFTKGCFVPFLYLQLFSCTLGCSAVLQIFLQHTSSLLLYPMMTCCTLEYLVYTPPPRSDSFVVFPYL